MSIADGDYWGAGLSIVSVVPYLGDAIAKPLKATRMARKAAKLKRLKAKAAKLAEKLGDLRKGKKPKPGKGAKGGGGAGSKKPDGGHIPKKKSAKEKLEEHRRAAKRKAQKEKMDEADAKGMDKPPKVTKEESEWLNSDPRNKELVYDPDSGKYEVGEAKAVLKAESEGIIEAPVSRDIDYSGRGNEGGGDFVDGNGTAWDAKDTRMGAKRIQGKLDDGENIMVHGPSSELDKIRDTVQTGEGTGRIVFVPTD